MISRSLITNWHAISIRLILSAHCISRTPPNYLLGLARHTVWKRSKRWDRIVLSTDRTGLAADRRYIESHAQANHDYGLHQLCREVLPGDCPVPTFRQPGDPCGS